MSSQPCNEPALRWPLDIILDGDLSHIFDMLHQFMVPKILEDLMLRLSDHHAPN